MADISKLKNYRTIYKRYYEIDFDKSYVVHHIDFNRENNDISNLVLLPKELHEKYHTIINSITISIDKPKADGFIDIRLSNLNLTDYNFNMFKLLPEIILECSKWLYFKKYGYSVATQRFIWGKENGNI